MISSTTMISEQSHFHHCEVVHSQDVHFQSHSNSFLMGTGFAFSQEKYYVNKWYRWKSESLEIYRDNNNSIWTLDSVITI